MSGAINEKFSISDFSKKIIKATCIIALIAFTIFLVLKGFKVILLILAGILVATLFKGIASIIESKTPLNANWSLGVATLIVLTICTLTVCLMYPRVSSQVEELEIELPKAAKEAKEKLQSNKVGAITLGELEGFKEGLTKNKEQLTSFFSSLFGGLADLYIILFLGLFFMTQPDLYKNGLIMLFPKSKRKRATEVLLTIGYTLKRWLLGKLLSMLVVGILTGIGLAIIGIPLALTLAIFASIITFIPNFGPFLSLIPALLIALTMGSEYALSVTILYIVIQAIESNIITPVIQRKMIAFPLAMVLIAQVILGIFTGILGLILAVPVIAIVIVVIKMVYIEDILGDNEVDVVGEELFVED